jgi:hypothetical protein
MSDSFPFPHPTLTPIIGTPTHLTLRPFFRQLYANARTVDSLRGGGMHGYLALVMSPQAYFALAGEAFIVPTHPGANPVHPPAATGPQITEINRVYAAALADLVEFRKIHQLLKKQIFEAIEPLYLAELEDGAMGFADVSAATLVTHLTNEYGRITGDEKDANMASLDLPWNPDERLETVWTRLAHSQLIARDAGTPIPDDVLMRKTLRVIENTNVFADYAKRWHERPEADQTFAELRKFFGAADKQRRRHLTAQSGGFHGAFASTTLPPLANLNLSPPPAPLPMQPPANSALAATTASSPAATPTNRTTAPSSHINTTGGVQLFYCWTHGMGKNHAHTSSTCQRKAPGHQDTATYDNMLGGNDTLQRARPARNPNTTPRNPNANPNSRSNS